MPFPRLHSLLLLLHQLPILPIVEGTALSVACPAVDNQVPFYLDPSVNAGGATVITNPVSACTECDQPASTYFASAGTPAPFGGPAPIPYSDVLVPGPGNNFAYILTCPNACVCDANGLCAQVVTPMTNIALYPLCMSER